MKGNLGQTVEAHGHDRRSNSNRGIARQGAVFRWAGSHTSGEDRIQSDRNGTGQTYLSPMGMSAQHDLKACVCSLPVNLRRMREENGNLIVWNGGGYFLDIIGAIVVGIINA